MDDIDRIVAAIFAAAMCAGQTSDHGEFFKAYDYFMSMTKDREANAASARDREAGAAATPEREAGAPPPPPPARSPPSRPWRR